MHGEGRRIAFLWFAWLWTSCTTHGGGCHEVLSARDFRFPDVGLSRDVGTGAMGPRGWAHWVLDVGRF